MGTTWSDAGQGWEATEGVVYAPELVAAGEGSLLLRGFQSADGAAYVQEWRCVVG